MSDSFKFSSVQGYFSFYFISNPFNLRPAHVLPIGRGSQERLGDGVQFVHEQLRLLRIGILHVAVGVGDLKAVKVIYLVDFKARN